uniref:RRM domain-containing protein n=1 Tax=Meloidogyne hapla TaxID=6305 RepID=A0A1I8BTT2_MELHA
MAETTRTTPSPLAVAHAVTRSESSFPLRPPTNSVGFSQRIEAPSLLNDPRTISKQRATAAIALQNQLSQNVPPPIEEELPTAVDGVDEAFSMDGVHQHNESEKSKQEITKNIERQNVQVVQQVGAVLQQVQGVHENTDSRQIIEPVQRQVLPETKVINEGVQAVQEQIQPIQQVQTEHSEVEQQRNDLKVQDTVQQQQIPKQNIQDKDIVQQKPLNVQSMLEMSPINIKKSSSQPEQHPATSEVQEQQNTERNKNSESPRIKVYGHNPFKTIQFGRILQAVGERKKELAVKILRHHKNPPDHVQSLEYGRHQKHDQGEREKQVEEKQLNEQANQEILQNEQQKPQINEQQTQQLKEETKQEQPQLKETQQQQNNNEQTNEETKQQNDQKPEQRLEQNQQKETQQPKEQLKEQQNLEENKQEKQTSQHLENSLAKALAAKKQIYEPIKSNLLLRRRGMHEHTFTLTPPRPVDVSAGNNNNGIEEREKAEMTIQRRVDAIRAVEKRLQVKTIEIPKEESLELNTTEIIAAKQSDWETNSEATDHIFSKTSNGDSGDGEAMHRILFGEPVQITPKSVLSEDKEEKTSQALEKNQPKIETINLFGFPKKFETTQSPAAMWWEPMVNSGRKEEAKQNQKVFLPMEERLKNRKQVNDQLDFATITASASLDNETNETTPLPFTLPADGPVAQEVRENALLAPQRVADLPKNKLRIFSINYGNPGWRKQISEISNEEKMDENNKENNVANKTIVENLNEMNSSISDVTVQTVQSTEANENKENRTNQVLSLRKSLPIYTLEWDKENKQIQGPKENKTVSENKNVSAAEQSVETLFPPQLENADNLNINETKSVENPKFNSSSKSISENKRKKLQPPPTSEEFADVMLREIDDQEKVRFSFSSHNISNTTTIPQLNFPRQFDDAKTLKHKHIEENNDGNFADYYVDEIPSGNLTHAFLSRRSAANVLAENHVLVDGVKIFKNETNGEINEIQGKKKKRKSKKKKKLEGIEENEGIIPPTASLATSEKLPPLDAFPSPPPLDSRGKIAIVAAASSKQFAQLPPSPPQTLIKQKKFQNIDYKRELEQRGSEHKTVETLAIELAKASKDNQLNVSEGENNKKNNSNRHKNRRKHLLKQQREQEEKNEERDNVEQKHDSQQKQIKEYRNQQFAALIATTSRPMRMGVDYEVADDDGNVDREINLHQTSQIPKFRTTRLPLFKRRQLDKIALEVFGPSAFDPSVEHPQIDVALLSRRPLNQKFRHKRPPTRVEQIETSTGMGMGLPDEETDISPFDAERAQLLERLRHNHKTRQEEHIEETFDDTEATHITRKEQNFNKNTKEIQQKNNLETSFTPERDSFTTISLPNFENKNKLERVETRFEKASPFDDRHEEEHFEDEEEPRAMASRNAEIRRKPSLASVPFIPPNTNFKDEEISSINNEAAVKRSISHLQIKKDGNPLFTPKDNKPMMKMPSETIEKMAKIDERNDIVSEKESLDDVLIPMNEAKHQIEAETTEATIKTPIQTTTKIEKQIEKQNLNKEKSGNNYWQFFVEPNIYRTTTEFPEEEETQFYNADKYFHLPNRRQNNKQRENENG